MVLISLLLLPQSTYRTSFSIGSALAFGNAAKAVAGNINPANDKSIDRMFFQLHSGGYNLIVGCAGGFTCMGTSLLSVRFMMTAPAWTPNPIKPPLFCTKHWDPKSEM